MPPGRQQGGPVKWISLIVVSALMGVLVTGAAYWINNREQFRRFTGRVGGKTLENLGVIQLPDSAVRGRAPKFELEEDQSLHFEWRYGADIPDEQSVEQLEFPHEFVTQVPDFPERFRRVLELTRQYQFTAARQELDSLIKEFGDDVPPAVRRARELILLTWGDRLLHEGRNAQAAMVLLDLESLNPRDRSFERPLGLAYYRAGDKEKAFPFLSAVYERAGRKANLNFELGELYYLRGEFDRAKPLLESVTGARRSEAARLLRKIDRESYVEGDFREVQGYDEGHFRITFDGTQNTRTAYGTRVILEQARRDIGRRFGFYPKDKISVVLYTRVQYNRALSAPNWSGALFDGKIRLPTKGLGSNALPLKNTIYHEYVHAVVVRMGGERVPGWLHEGLAQYFEPDARGYRFSEFDLNRHGALTFANLENGFSGLPGRYVSVAYAQSQSFVGYLIQEHGGMFRIKRLLGELNKGKDTHEALMAAYGMDRGTLEGRWRSSLERKMDR